MVSVGMHRRLSRIFDERSKKAIVVTLEDTVLAGPGPGLERPGDMAKNIAVGGTDAIMGYRGLFERLDEATSRVAGILNVTASTLKGDASRKTRIGSVEDAVRLGLDAVGVHVVIGAPYEHEMLMTLGEIAAECDRLGMPLYALMRAYDREGHDKAHRFSEGIRHATRVGVDLGAHMIEVPFTGDVDSFRTVVECASSVPVLIAGGPKVCLDELLARVSLAVQAGAAGVSFGRNVVERADPAASVRVLRSVVHDGVTAAVALARAGLSACD